MAEKTPDIYCQLNFLNRYKSFLKVNEYVREILFMKSYLTPIGH